jgi:tetratricopeptide (TPR) repeat protein
LQQIEYELSDDEIYQLYADWNDLAYNLTKTELLNKIGNELIQLGKSRDSDLLIGAGFDALSDACMTTNDFNMGLEYVSHALTHLERYENTFELIEAYNHQGTFLYMLNRLEEALASFQDALALSTDSRTPRIFKATSNAHYQIALLQVLFGNPASGYEHGVKALEIAEQCQHSYSIIQAYGIKSLASFYLGELTRSREEALVGIQLAERTKGWRMLGYLHCYAALAEIALGAIDAARKHAEEAVQLGEKFGHQDIVAFGCRTLGELNRLLFDYDKAIHHYQKGFESAPEHFLGIDNLYRLGLAQYFQDGESGEHQILTAGDILEENSIHIGSITAKICRGIRASALEEWQKAEQLATEIEAETIRNGLANYHAIAILLLGEVAFARGDYEAANEHFRFVAGEARCMKNPWLEIKAEAEIEKTLTAQKEDASACKERIDALINQLESQVTHPETRKKFAAFYQQVSKRACVATITL